MKKLVVINDKSIDSITCKVAKKLFIFDGIYLLNGNSVVKFLNDENPNFVFLDLIDESFEEDMLDWLSKLDSIKRLRVTVFRLSPFKTFLFRVLPLKLIDSFIEGMVENKVVR